MSDVRMVRFNWFLGCCLVGLLGLAPSISFAQAAPALTSCQQYAAAAANACTIDSTTNTFRQLVVDVNCAYIEPSSAPENTVSYAYRARCLNSDGSVNAYPMEPEPGSAPSIFFNNVSYPALLPGVSSAYQTAPISGVSVTLPYRGFISLGSSEPEPECPDWTAGEFSGWKAPTPNGSGNVCIDGCLASIALSSPPGPLYVGEWQGQTCTSSDAPAPLPVQDSDLPDDPEAPGTGEPGDPNAPPGTGGGGFHCDAPPVCNGDGVTCSMLYQQWRHRCTDQSDGIAAQEGFGRVVDSVNEGASSIGSSVDATTSAVNEAGLKIDGTTAAVNEVSNRLDGIGDNIAGIQTGVIETHNQLSGLRGDLGGAFSDGGVGADEGVLGGLVGGVTLSTDSLDDSGWGLSRSCPTWQNITFPLGGSMVTIPLSDFEGHCTIFEWSGLLLLALSAYVALRIFMKE